MTAADTASAPVPAVNASGQSLLEVKDFRLDIETFDGVLKVLDGIDFKLARGETLGLVGETGCGKSVTAKSIMRLLPSPPARVITGEIRFNGENLLTFDSQAMRRLRGIEIAMIFQDPMTYLNPVFTIGQQMVDVIMAHQQVLPASQRLNRRRARHKAIAMLAKVHLPNPEVQIDNYPHQLSGGMRQRVLIATALSGSPALLIADEPTTALDVTIQAQILRLINELVRDMQLSVLMISHDLGVVAKICQRIAVMYAGNIVEDLPVGRLFAQPKHPYTQGLLKAIPQLDGSIRELAIIPGSIPNLMAPPAGCRFHRRCPRVMAICRAVKPQLAEIDRGHKVACHLFGDRHG